MDVPEGVILYAFNHICFGGGREENIRGWGTSDNKKPINLEPKRRG
ncbi:MULTISPECIES: hypothetical protein [Enterobacter]|nr:MULTISPECIES: hypothetical protein [Enterobacter]MDO2448156.1 hypothetical protein [Enterobacter vonholyi]